MSELPYAIATCPQCNYSLQGLSESRCPECGYTYLPRTQLFRARQPDKRLVIGMAILLAIALVIYLSSVVAGLRRTLKQSDVVTLVFWLWPLGMLGWMLWSARGVPQQYILVDDDGVTFVDSGVSEHCSGGRIDAVTHTPMGFELHDADGNHIASLPDLFQPHHADVMALLQAIRDRCRIWRARENKTGQALEEPGPQTD